MLNVLVLSPHPDDAEIVIGGTIKKLSAKYNIIMIYLTCGELSTSGMPKLRIEESVLACHSLGIEDREYLHIPDLEVSRESINQQRMLIKLIREIKPQIIFSPHYTDSHFDHQETYWLAKRCRDIAATKKFEELGISYFCKYLFFFGQNIAENNNSFFIDVSETYEYKTQSIDSYKSQFAETTRKSYLKDVLLKRIIEKDKYCGALFGVEYAEEIQYEGHLMLSDISDVLLANK